MNDFLVNQNERYASALIDAFLAWGRIGQGWNVYNYAVNLEPPFSPIRAEAQPTIPLRDDARIRSGFGRLFRRSESPLLNSFLLPESFHANPQADEAAAKLSAYYRSEEITELQILLPNDLDVSPVLTEQFLLSLSSCRTPVGFELLADSREIILQIACDTGYSSHLKNQLQSFFPNLPIIKERKGFLDSYFDNRQSVVIADFGLSSNFLLPLQVFRSFNPDPLTGLISSLGSLQLDEKALFQVLFQPARFAWAEEAQKLQANSSFRKLLQENNCALSSALREKLSSALFAVVIRIVIESTNKERSWENLKRIGGNLAQFCNPNGNELIALSSDDYLGNNHFLSILTRKSYRSGMLLNVSELSSFAHLPSTCVKVDRLKRYEDDSRLAPEFATRGNIILGENYHAGQSQIIRLSDEQRLKHLWLMGSSGSGKSTLITRLVEQDLNLGNAVCVIEPHGDLIESIIARLPENRLKDVILFSHEDENFPISFNILSAHSELERTLLASDLAAIFQKFWTSQGDIISNLLHNAILAFLSSTTGGTLVDLKHFLVDKEFREKFLETVTDDEIRFYWQKEFPALGGKPHAPLLTRLDLFLRSKLIRNIIAQKDNKLDFRRIMDERKILLVKLTHGSIGAENSNLLGSLIVAKLYQAAISRQNIAEEQRSNLFVYSDESHHFLVPSMALLLSGARKYRVGLLVSHQDTQQIATRDADILSSLMTNCYTRICFRSDMDAEKLAKGFSFFTAEHLKNLGVGEAIVRLEQSRFSFNLKTFPLEPVSQDVAEQRKNAIVEYTQRNYASPKAEVEGKLTTIKMDSLSEINTENSDLSETVKESEKFTAESPKTKTEKAKDGPTSAEKINEHRFLQFIIKRIGEREGYVATLEKEVFGGIGKVDVALENETHKIACEIAVTNTIEYELQNIQKCLVSGFCKVMVISSDTKHLQNIKKKAEIVISGDQLKKVHFLEPENFHLFLESLKTQSSNSANWTAKIKGYTINISYKSADEKEREARTQILTGIFKETRNEKRIERSDVSDNQYQSQDPVKATGGIAPFGYRWKEGSLVIEEKEVAVRKLIYELFLKHRRKKTVARLLNDLGYRTRYEALFSDTTIDRLLRDTTAKGIRIVDGKEIQVEPIVSAEIWERANSILGSPKIARQAVRLFAGLAYCGCGGKMIVPSSTEKYVCVNCRHKIAIADLEEIFVSQLTEFPVDSEIISDSDKSQSLFDYWQYLTDKEKRIVTEQIIYKIVIGKTEIDIEYAYAPISLKTAASGQQNSEGNETPIEPVQEQNQTNLNEPLMNEAEAARFLGISKMTLLRRRNAGEIGFFRVGFRILYSKEKHLIPFLTQCEKGK